MESLFNKAARGAGMSWGLAEEAGFAAIWLISHALDGAGLLSRHLNQAQHLCWQDTRPKIQECVWHAEHRDNPLCPIALGASVSDYLCVDPALFHGEGHRFERVSYPGLLLPFFALSVQGAADSICLSDGKNTVHLDGHGRIGGDVSAFMKVAIADLSVKTSDQYFQPADLSENSANRRLIDSAVINKLDRFAMLTTVPASEASRANAGATLGDDD